MMWLWFVAAASGAGLTLGLPSGTIRADLTNHIEMAASNDAGEPLEVAPAVYVDGVRVPIAATVKPGVWSYAFVAPEDGAQLTIRAEVDDVRREWIEPVERVPRSGLKMDGVSVRSSAEYVDLVVYGEALPAPEDLQVVASEGVVESIERGGNGLVVRVSLEKNNNARNVLVAARDARGGGAPALTRVAVSQQQRLRYPAEDGSEMRVRVNGRVYGPFRSKGGMIEGVVEQRPGETKAEVIIADDLGNESRAPQTFSGGGFPSLVFVPAGAFYPGVGAPRVFVASAEWDGRTVTDGSPSCRTPTQGAVRMAPIEPGLWVAELKDVGKTVQSIPMVCELGNSESFTFRLAAPKGIPRSLKLRALPDQIATDFPVSDVQVKLEDDYGEILPAKRVKLVADLGTLKEVGRDDRLRMWEYRGEGRAVQSGEDRLVASFIYPPGNGRVATLKSSHANVPQSGTVVLYARALNEVGLPLAGVRVHMSAGDAAVSSVTGIDGWAQGAVMLPEGAGPVVSEVRTPYRVRKSILFRGEASSEARPGRPDLTTTQALSFRVGRVSTVSVDVDPPVLYAGASAAARIRIQLKDSAGKLVPGEFPLIQASEGQFGPIKEVEDGLYETVYQPDSAGRARTIQLVARSASGRVSMTRSLKVEPQPVFRSLGLAVGAISNFGRINSLMGSLDFEQRLGWLNGRILLRVGVSGWSQTSQIDQVDGAADGYFTRLTLVPIHFGLLGRQDWGMVSGWIGASGVLAPGLSFERFGQQTGFSKSLLLPPGLMAHAGVAYRLPLGEAMAELRGVFLYRPRGGGGLQKQVGGVVFVLGYRFILD